MTEITLRPARPEDVELAVPLILSSGSQAFNWVFTTSTRDCSDFIAYAYTSGQGQFGYQNHVVAEVDHLVVGTIAFYTRSEFLRFNLRTGALIVSFYGWKQCWSVFYRGLKTESTLPPPKKHHLYLAHVAVSDKVQGRGIGSQLISYAMASEKNQGTAVSLDVAHSNPQAEKLYHRLGFQKLHSRPGAHTSVPGHNFMVRSRDAH